MNKPQLKDHRQIGQELEIFKTDELAPGAIFWLPNGMKIVKQLEEYIRKENEAHGFQEIQTPILIKTKIFQQSGHFKYYEKSMYNVKFDEHYSLKPMNCPETALIFRHKNRSYRDLPLRFSEFGRLHRRELSGVVGGLLRVTEFTQDDGHAFVREDQLENEVLAILKWISKFHSTLGFKSKFYLGTKPDKALGDEKIWEKSEKILKDALKKSGVNFEIREKDGVFYGPKIDIDITDIQNRTWTVSTCQADFNIPTQFNLEYEDKDGKFKRPIMVHRSIFGSFERFIGILLENFQGSLPLWLSPVQVVIIPITDKHVSHSKKILNELKENGIRAELDDRAETMQSKVRDAALQKVPYLVIIGDKEIEDSVLSVRQRSGKVEKFTLSVFLQNLKKEIDKKI